MIKGAQKQLIVVRTQSSPYFDEAYFVLRREIESQKHKKTDILKEANRILEESTLSYQSPQKKKVCENEDKVSRSCRCFRSFGKHFRC